VHSDIWDYWPSSPKLDPTGFDVEALDGSLGVVESSTHYVGWSFLVVVTSPESADRLLVPAGLVEQIDADAATVLLDREREEVLRAPTYGGNGDLEPLYRAQLSAYYGLRAAQRERLSTRGSGASHPGQSDGPGSPDAGPVTLHRKEVSTCTSESERSY
jgi:hypothetical protein